jgi:DNA topoisomerase VI subunit B
VPDPNLPEIKVIDQPRRRLAPVLQRATFRTSRLAEFCSRRELVAQSGHGVEDWPLVICKELVDNALDIAEEVGVAPEVRLFVSTERGEITVIDNGPGIPPETVAGILDYSVRVSSREAYVSPTRGAQGNALKTIVAMGFALDSTEPVETIIEAGGTAHRIVFRVDQVRQEPRIDHQTAPSNVKTGTSVRLRWPELACSYLLRSHSRFLQIADDFAWLNPHLSITASWNNRCHVERVATKPDWKKWRANEPTSAHWYDLARLERYMGAHIARDQDLGRERTVREFISEFRGLSGSAKQKAVLDEVGASRASLASYFGYPEADHAANARLLAACQKHTRPVKPGDVGAIGKDHLEAIFVAGGVDPRTFKYRRGFDMQDGVPYVVEVAFGCDPDPKSDKPRRIITGANWSVAINNPWRSFGAVGESLDSVLAEQRAGRDKPVHFLLHLAMPRIEYTDRGKTAISLIGADDEDDEDE